MMGHFDPKTLLALLILKKVLRQKCPKLRPLEEFL
jgi:hypothetical protein